MRVGGVIEQDQGFIMTHVYDMYIWYIWDGSGMVLGVGCMIEQNQLWLCDKSSRVNYTSVTQSYSRASYSEIQRLLTYSGFGHS